LYCGFLYFNCQFFQFFYTKSLFIWIWIPIPIGSGFNNSLDPDSAKYPDPDYVNPDAKNCLNDVNSKGYTKIEIKKIVNAAQAQPEDRG